MSGDQKCHDPQCGDSTWDHDCPAPPGNYEVRGGMTYRLPERSTLRDRIAEGIRGACPAEEDCQADEEACFETHPVHEAFSRDGVILHVRANVDGLTELVVGIVGDYMDETLCKAPRELVGRRR